MTVTVLLISQCENQNSVVKEIECVRETVDSGKQIITDSHLFDRRKISDLRALQQAASNFSWDRITTAASLHQPIQIWHQ